MYDYEEAQIEALETQIEALEKKNTELRELCELLFQTIQNKNKEIKMPLIVDEDLFSRTNPKTLREEQRERIRNAIENYLPCQNVSAKRTLNEMIDQLVLLVQDEMKDN